MSIIKAIGLKKYYGKDENIVRALDDINFEVKRGEFLGILGASGSGKSTLLHIIGGLDNPTEGTVLVDGTDIFKLTDDQITIFRRRQIGYIFQNFNLIPILNVYENIILPLELDGLSIDKDYIEELIRILGLQDKKFTLPSKLSGGQQQRVAIARALAIKPAIILADEPTGSLDSKMEQEVVGLLRLMAKRFNQTILMITHNEDIAQISHRIINIEDGKIIKV